MKKYNCYAYTPVMTLFDDLYCFFYFYKACLVRMQFNLYEISPLDKTSSISSCDYSDDKA